MRKHSDREAKTSQSPLRLIPCRVEPGMFRDEFLVYLDVVDPQNPNQSLTVQLLVDQREVINLRGTPKRNQPAEGLLRVAFARKENGFVQVVLPQPPNLGSENILMEESRVRPDAGP